jgi:hypothetical protein
MAPPRSKNMSHRMGRRGLVPTLGRDGASTGNYLTNLCRAGSKVRMMLLPGVGHLSVARDSADVAVPMDGRPFAGIFPPSDCANR